MAEWPWNYFFSECPRPRRAVERTPGDNLELADLKIEVGRSFHPLAARCYRFTDPATGGRMVFSGDTFYHQGLPLFAKDCDVLVHEAAASADAEIPDLMRSLHSRPQDAAQVAWL